MVKQKQKRDKKLHCNTCGTKRALRVGFAAKSEEDGERMMHFFDLNKLRNAIKADKNFPTPETVVGVCPVCYQSTFFEFKNAKLIPVA